MGGPARPVVRGVGLHAQQQAPPPVASASTTAAAPHPRSERHVYRLDFVLTTSEGTGAPSSTSFTLNLQELEKGEVVVGKNVVISPPSPGPNPGAGPRQDVGTKVVATFQTLGDDVILDVSVEMSTFDPPSTVRKMVTKGNALASAGKPSLVTSLEDEHKRYQLTVTPTKLR